MARYYRRSSGGGGGARWLNSKYSGQCVHCCKAIAAGDLVYWRGSGQGVLCEKCGRAAGLAGDNAQAIEAVRDGLNSADPATRERCRQLLNIGPSNAERCARISMDAANELAAERAALDMMGGSLSFGGGQW